MHSSKVSKIILFVTKKVFEDVYLTLDHILVAKDWYLKMFFKVIMRVDKFWRSVVTAFNFET